MTRILLSPGTRDRLAGDISARLDGLPHELVCARPGEPPPPGIDIAFLSRDVAVSSASTRLAPTLDAFYAALRASPRLQWLHLFSAGADRAIYHELRQGGVRITTSAGTAAHVVAHSAIGGMLALARQLPLLAEAQRAHRWTSLHDSGLPRDLRGATAVVVGLGPIGERIARLLGALEMRAIGVRHRAAPHPACVRTAVYDDIDSVLGEAQWLFLCCPLTDTTRGLLDRARLARLPEGAHLVNVARGPVVDEPALVEALRTRRLAGAFLDVFAHEPLAADSPLWDMPDVILTPHAASHADSNAGCVADLFLDNLARWRQGQPLRNPMEAG